MRRSGVIVKESPRTEIWRNFFTIRAERSWNALPGFVREQPSVNSFKNAYDRWVAKKDSGERANANEQSQTQERENENRLI